MNEVETSIKEYNIKTAQLWKIESRKLLIEYRNNKKNFEKILHDVVGKGNGVLRNIKTEDFPRFAEYVRDSLPKIEKGEYDIFVAKSFSGKTPISFISKICHIINPKDYPIIWDKNVRTILKTGESKKSWLTKFNEYKHKQANEKTFEKLYMIDSKIWSGDTV